MSTLTLAWREWWARLFRTPAAASPPPVAPLRPVPQVVAAEAAVTEPVVAVAVRPEPDVAPLLEIVQRPELAPVAPAPAPVDALARERTLAGLKSLQQIPALQSLANGFLHALNQPQVSVPEVVDAIRKDSGLCVRLLRAANSVTVASEQRIEDLDTAVQMLGVLRVRKMMQAMFTLRDGHRVAAGFDWRHLWIHALATAAIAEELERRLRPNGDSQIHLAGLLHDVGKIVLSTLAPDSYREVLMRAWHDGGTLDELERNMLGVDHREAGVAFAEHNRLPEIVVQAIAHHHCPQEATAYRLEVALISLANHLSKAHGLGFSGARLREADVEFDQHPAWAVVQGMVCGWSDAATIEADMGGFLTGLRIELRSLRENT
jgi:putative nucleotidyltransferase with HDIG domain